MARPTAAGSRKRKRPVSTAIPLQTQSPLLRLSGEIRNKIYQYTLEETRPLHIDGRRHRALPTKSQMRRFHHMNELVRTCRQLRLEAKDMGSTWAHAFWSYDVIQVTSKPARILVQTTSHPDSILYHNRNTGPKYYSIDSDIFEKHIGLCEAHPHLEVAILTNALRIAQGCRGLLVAGAAIQLLLRGKEVFFEVDAKFASEVDKVVRAMTVVDGMGSFAEGWRYPDNLKFFPQESYNESELRSPQPRKKKGFEDWVAQIREWYEHGI